MMNRSQSWNDSGGSDGGYGTSSGRTSLKSGSPYQTSSMQQHNTLYEYIQDDVLLFETNDDVDDDEHQQQKSKQQQHETVANKHENVEKKPIQRRTRRKSTNDIKVIRNPLISSVILGVYILVHIELTIV